MWDEMVRIGQVCYGWLQIFEKSCKFLYGTSTMADFVLYFRTDFGKGFAQFFRSKNGVVTKSVCATLFGGNLSANNAFE